LLFVLKISALGAHAAYVAGWDPFAACFGDSSLRFQRGLRVNAGKRDLGIAGRTKLRRGWYAFTVSSLF
jgi:hypothetical protein